MDITIPTRATKQHIQDNRSEYAGTIKALWNMDLSDPGRVKISPMMKLLLSHTSTNLFPVSLVKTSASGTQKIWAVTNDGMYLGTVSSFAKDVTAGTPVVSYIYSDAVEFNGALIVSATTAISFNDISRLAAGTWDNDWWTSTLGQTPLSPIYIPLHVSFNNLLCIGYNNVIHTVDIYNNVTLNRIVLKTEYQIMWMRSTASQMFIGTYNNQMRESRIFVWDGKSENFVNDYGVGHPTALSCAIKNGIPYVVNGGGELLKFNGAGFDTVAVFPVFPKQIDLSAYPSPPPSTATYSPRAIHPNGMVVDNDRILMLVMGINDIDSYNRPEYMNAGIWEYDESVGLYHRYSLSKTTATNVDYGTQGGVYLPGALLVDTKNSGYIYAGALLYTAVDSSAFLYSLQILDTSDTIPKRGYFVTPIIESSQITDLWKKIWLKFQYFKNSTDRIVVKYRTTKSTTLPFIPASTSKLVWTSTTQFTSTSASFANVVVGDEVEVVLGNGSGTSAHITAISVNAGTYTVTLDEAMLVSVNDRSLARVNNWKKLGTFSSQTDVYNSLAIDDGSISPVSGTWIQFKVELRGTGQSPIFEELTVNSSVENKYNE